jgi:hypothetical protein
MRKNQDLSRVLDTLQGNVADNDKGDFSAANKGNANHDLDSVGGKTLEVLNLDKLAFSSGWQ